MVELIIGHLEIGFPRKRSQDAIQNAHFNPSIVAPLDRLVVVYCPGKSRQRAPERAIHKSAFKKRRLSVRGPRLPFRPPGTNSLSRSH